MSDASDFVGTWSLESFRATGPDGRVVHPMGENPVGRITYHDDGRMSVQVMSAGREPLSTEAWRMAPPEEVVDAFGTFIAYFGTYSIDEEAGEVTHHLEAASIPNWVGTDQVRRYEFWNGTLTLSTPPMMMDGVAVESTLVWRRD